MARFETPGRYAADWEWVMESFHYHSDIGWVLCMRADSREDAIKKGHEWAWNRMRAYNNQTGEVIDPWS